MNKTTTIDCEYLNQQFAGAFLLSSKENALFIENNTAKNTNKLLNALHADGKRPEDVKYAIITHVHLDHAAGSSALLKACSNATLLCHPRALKHILDPKKLVAGAKAVYGDETFQQLYGEIDAIPESRARAVQDEETLEIDASIKLRFLHTRGHANHHMCILEEYSESVFTGDTFGLCYPALQTSGLYIFPSSSPTDFDPIAAMESLHRILKTRAKTAYLTHFGAITGLSSAAAMLQMFLEKYQSILESAVTSSDADHELTAICQREVLKVHLKHCESNKITFDQTQWKLMEIDLKLNGAGIAVAAMRRRHESDSKN